MFLAKGGKKIISLPKKFDDVVKNNDVMCVMEKRKSRRLFDREEFLTVTELSYLLWMTQGVKEVAGNAVRVSVRVVPSAGSRHALETYLYINRVEGLDPGLYHYLAEEHKLEFISYYKEQTQELSAAFLGKPTFRRKCSCFHMDSCSISNGMGDIRNGRRNIFFWMPDMFVRIYIWQVNRLAVGCLCYSAYEQELADEFLGLEKKQGYQKEEEFVIYAACVGR